jgi:hypothetical protein
VSQSDKGGHIMNQSLFQKMILDHLIRYKESSLNVKEQGKGYGRWKNNSYSHILPRPQETHNIISVFRDDIVKNYWSKIDHSPGNLKSSQVMCINFFAALDFASNALKTTFFKNYVKCDTFINQYFEVNCNDSGGFSKPTQIDYVVRTEYNGVKLNNLFEIKYAETTFKKSVKKANLKKYQSKFTGQACTINQKQYNQTNTPSHVQYNKINTLLKKPITFDEFMEHYQLYRNLFNTSICHGATFSTIVPKLNHKLIKEFNVFKERFRSRLKKENSHLKDRIQLLFWEDLIEDVLRLSGENNLTTLLQHYHEFKQKYMIDSPTPQD